MNLLKDLKVQIVLIAVTIGLLATVAGYAVHWERTRITKEDLQSIQVNITSVQIVQAEVNKILLLAPHGGKVENAPLDIQAVHRMLMLESTKLRGG